MFRHEIRRQIPLSFETYQTVIQSASMAYFSFGFTEGSFLLLNDQKHLMSVVEDLINNKQKGLNEFIKNSEGTDIIKLSSQYFSTGHNVSVNSKPDHPPGYPQRFACFHFPGVGLLPNFLCPGGWSFELEKFPTVLKEKCRNFSICFKETGAV